MPAATAARSRTVPGGRWLAGGDGLPPQGLWLADGSPVAEAPEFAGVDWTADPPDEQEVSPAPAVREVLKAGFWDRSQGDGAGFAVGGVADTLPPGVVLAGLAGDTWAAGLGRLSDDELIGVLRAARRLASWAAAMELAAAGELWRRRAAEEAAGDTGAAERTGDEIAAALTLTGRAADNVLDLSIALQRLPATAAALASGVIDYPRAAVIADELAGLSDADMGAVERAVIGAAGGQTTTQLRRAACRAVIAADPDAARKRKERALREARVERWTETSGTAALAGRDLPPLSVLAADQNLSALAGQLKTAGCAGTMDALRASVYLALLAGVPLTDLLPAGLGASGHAGNPGGGRPANSPDASAPSVYPAAAGPGAAPAATGPAAQPPVTGPAADPAATGPARQPPVAGLAPEPPITGPAASSPVPQPPASGPAPPPAVTESAADPAATGPAPQPPASGLAPPPAVTGPAADPRATGLVAAGRGGVPGVKGAVNLTVPLATWLGLSGEPGHAAGAGLLDAADSRDLAGVLAAHPGTRWCLTFTDADGHPVIHGCARTGTPPGQRRAPPATSSPPHRHRAPPTTGPPPAGPRAGASAGRPPPAARGGTWTFTLTWLGGGDCDHARQTPAYQPTPTLRHLVKTRQPTCTFPGCARPGSYADLDHTIPYDHGGRTCLCNLAPLCRHHHQLKQARGWTLRQPTPGTMTWTTPAGRHYTVQHRCPA